MLTFGVLWLDRARQSARRAAVAGLRLFFPAGASRLTASRLQALSSLVTVHLYEYDADTWRSRQIDPRDAGNLESWLAPRRETEALLAEAEPALKPIRDLALQAIETAVLPGTRQVALRFRGLTFARWAREGMVYGAGDPREPLTPDRRGELERLVRDLEKNRSAASSAVRHPLYRAQPERWLASLVAADPGRIDARLDARFVYAQMPVISAGDRGVVDLVAATLSGRLAVLELKVSEDPHLILQAVDYWLRVRWHHAQQDFTRFGYFPGVVLDPRPPLLLLVAPAIRFHSANDVLLRCLNPEIEISRVGVSENWRRGLKIVLRQT